MATHGKCAIGTANVSILNSVFHRYENECENVKTFSHFLTPECSCNRKTLERRKSFTSFACLCINSQILSPGHSQNNSHLFILFLKIQSCSNEAYTNKLVVNTSFCLHNEIPINFIDNIIISVSISTLIWIKKNRLTRHLYNWQLTLTLPIMT